MKFRAFIIPLCSLVICSFSVKVYASSLLKVGIWHAEIETQSGKQIPFLFELKEKSGKYEIDIINAAERLKVDEVRVVGDSLIFVMPFFDSEFRALITSDQLQGKWIRHFIGHNLEMNFHASYNDTSRFAITTAPESTITGRWKIKFDKSEDFSIGEFTQDKKGRVVGSILNLDGDYRYLEGRVNKDSLYLSTFDGSHCYLFTAKISQGAKSLEGGKFYAGYTTVISWNALFDKHAALPDAYGLTSLKPGFSHLSFHFKDLHGREVSLDSPEFKNKVIIVQFMGSWCPNCMDETAFLSRFYEKYKSKVAVVALAYERSTDFDRSLTSLMQFVKRFNVGYDVLITGYTNQTGEVLKSIPELKNFIAFPTTVILDRNGIVRKIHTGFTGPGTGRYYTEFEEEFTSYILKLYSE